MIENKSTQHSNGIADQVAGSAEHAIQATQKVANGALDSLSESVTQLRNQASPLIDRASNQASALWAKGVDGVHHTSQQISDSALRARNGTVNYVKEEPVKAMLIAAATGAALMALVSMMGHSQRRD